LSNTNVFTDIKNFNDESSIHYSQILFYRFCSDSTFLVFMKTHK